MGYTSLYRYVCSCGNFGSYSSRSSDWFYKIVFGMRTGKPKCLCCGITICSACKNGRYCHLCSERVNPFLKFLYEVLNVLMFLFGIPVFIGLIMLFSGANMSDIWNYVLIAFGGFYGMRFFRWFISLLIKSQ